MNLRIFAAAGLMAALVLPGAAAAQGTEVNVGSLEHDTSLPVEVTSDSLSVASDAGRAVFEGNVVVLQGPMRLAAARIEVSYSEAADGGTDIESMVASGGVTYANGTDAAESSEATYAPDEGTLRMTGDVLLTQGPAVMAGQALAIDLEAGTGVMEGRVRTVFRTSGQP